MPSPSADRCQVRWYGATGFDQCGAHRAATTGCAESVGVHRCDWWFDTSPRGACCTADDAVRAREGASLAQALRWWANHDGGETIPQRHLPLLRLLTEPCPMDGDAGAVQLNSDGRQAMRAHGYTQTDVGAWVRAREDGAS